MKNWLIKLLGGTPVSDVRVTVVHEIPSMRPIISEAVRGIFEEIDKRNPKKRPKSKAANMTEKQYEKFLLTNPKKKRE